MGRTPWTHGNRLFGYDPVRKRVWVLGRRLHHGFAGLVLACLGTALMAHDWRDRSEWLRLRPGA